LSLSQRLSEKAIDSNRSQILSDEFDSLKMLSFPSREIVLQVVKDQKEKSMAIRGLSNDEQNSTKDKFTQSDALDIRLHESLRILRDWVNETSYKQISHKIDSGKSEI